MIQYKKGYKYQLETGCTLFTGITIEKGINTPYISMTIDGIVTITKGYAWDGATIAFDTKNFMRGSLFHDALYQLMRQEHLGQEYRFDADLLLRTICRQDGMSRIRAWWVFRGVRKFGKGATIGEKPVLTAP